MLSYLKNLISANHNGNSPEKSGEDSEKKLQIATCALFIELAHSDDEFSKEEKELIISLIQKEFGLDTEEMGELMILADEKMKKNISLYEYTDIINRYFDKNEKYKILKNLWKLVLIDGKLDVHEEYFIRKVSSNLNMEHKDLIASKLEVKNSMN
ncbi:MAG: TerB family tellurite resistance protein [Bacteroidetes bacterium]|nr:TerB family tellurite resistance protein [Bacteroidota bacterium]